MSWLLHTALANALSVCLLACFVCVASRWIACASVRRALWILVLIKLINPPLLSIPLGDVMANVYAWAVPPAATVPADAASGTLAGGAAWQVPAAAADTIVDHARRALEAAGELVTLLGPVLLAVWIAGIVSVAAESWMQTRSFAHWVRTRTFADAALTAEVSTLCRTMGITRAPRVVMTRARLSPLLFALGPWAVIVFPQGLWTRLSADKRRSLLVHELIHYQRGDHWTRLIESVCTTLYWWHPVAWWVRRQIQEAEEISCDEAVLQHESRPVYAHAIVDAIDYLHRATAPRTQFACLLNDYRFLEQRLVRILRTDAGPQMAPRRRRAIVLAVLCLLPLQPIAINDGMFRRGVEEVADSSLPLLADSAPRQRR